MKYLYNKSIKINIISGKGGDGIISFHRNKYINKGGPDGGNGGKGGNIYVLSDKKVNSIYYLKNKKKIYSENGKKGKKKNCTGKNGKSIFIKLPINTKITIYKKEKKTIILKKNKIIKLIAKGGKKGLGNNMFKSSKNRTPIKYTKGKKGENIYIKIEQINKFDIFIIGNPNSGKSSLFKILTLKNTKINNYPFTTQKPKINNLKINKKKTKFSIVDTPPIIKNKIKKYKKKNNFFKNIINCKIILYIFDIKNKNKKNIKNIKIINKELKIYKNKIKKIKKIIIFNKCELINKKKIKKIKKKINKKNIIFISLKKNKGIKKLINKICKYLKIKKQKK